MMAQNNLAKKNQAAEDDLKNLVRGSIGIVRQQTKDLDEKKRTKLFHNTLKNIYASLRRNNNHSQSDDLLKWMYGQVNGQVPIKILKSPVTYDLISGIRDDTWDLSIQDEIQWLANRLKYSIEDLKKFRTYADKFENAVWNHEAESASNILDIIEDEFGHSLWGVELKIATLQIYEGLEKQKAYVAEIKKSVGRKNLAFMVQHMSARNEPNSSYSRFAANLNTRLDKWALTDDRKIYFKYKLRTATPSSVEGFSKVLKVSQNFSLIDIYETLIDVIQDLLLLPDQQILSPFLIEALTTLHPINDWRIEKALLRLGVTDKLANIQVTDWSNYLSAFEIESGKNTLRQTVKNEGKPNLSLLFTCAINFPDLSARSKDRNLKIGVIRRLSSVISKSETWMYNQSELLKLCKNLSGLSTFKGISYYLDEMFQSCVLPQEAQLLSLSLNNPWLSIEDYYLQQRRNDYKLGGFLSKGFSSVINRIQGVLEEQDKVFPLAVFVKEFLDRRDDMPPSDSLVSILPHSVRAARINAHMLCIEKYSKANMVRETVNLAADIVSNEPGLRHIINAEPLFRSCEWGDLSELSGELELGITLDAVWRISGNNKIATFKRFAFEALMKRNGVSLPSELLDRVNINSDNKKIIYYLRYFCIPSAMDMYSLLPRSRDVELERMKICAGLIFINKENENEYITEIASFERQHVIQDSIKIVDSSRIYVDLEAVKAWADKELREPFARYVALVKAGVGVTRPL